MITNASVLILAGGASTRMGQPKSLMKYDGQTWLDHQLQILVRRGVSAITIVLGHGAREIQKQVHIPENVQVVVNANPERGQFSSTKVGLAFQKSDHYCFILPIDVPVPDDFVWRLMLEEPQFDVVQPEYDGRGGHPILISPSFRERLLNKPDDSRLDILLHTDANLKRVKVTDEKILCNFNTPEEFRSFHPRL